MKEQPILGYDWEMGHEEIKLEIGTYYAGKGLYIGMLAKEDGVWESFSDLTINLPFERSDVHEAFIQDFGSKEKLKFIQKHKLGKILSERGHSGFCTYAKVAFDLKRLEELDPEGMKRFYKDHPELEEKSQVPKRKKRNQMERQNVGIQKERSYDRKGRPLAYFLLFVLTKWK